MLKTIGLRFRKVDILNFVSGTFFCSVISFVSLYDCETKYDNRK